MYVTRWIVHTETSRINGKFTNFFARMKIDRFYPPFDLFSKNPRSRYFWRANIEKKFLYSSLLQRYMDRRSIDKQRSKILHYEMDSLSLFWPTSKLSPNPKFLLSSPRSSRWLETKRYQLEEKKVERLSRVLFTVFQWFTPCVINPAASVCEARASYGAVCQNHACITIPLFGVPFPLPRDPLRDI